MKVVVCMVGKAPGALGRTERSSWALDRRTRRVLPASRAYPKKRMNRVVELWGIFDLVRNDFASRSLSHGGEYIDTILHDPSRAEVERWCVDMGEPGCYEVRAISSDYAHHRLRGCICSVCRPKRTA